MNPQNSVRRFYVFIMVFVTVMMAVTFVSAQEFITLANDRGVHKTVFTRGEGTQIVITLPYSATVQVLLHNPPQTPGPSPIPFIPATTVPAYIETRLGPRWLDEGVPCGKYSLEIRIDPPPPLQPKTEYRYFDYAIHELPCSPPPPPPPIPDVVVVALGVSAVAIAAVMSVLILTKWRARPPKEKAVIPPPVPTTPPTPTTPIRPPKEGVRRTPIVRGTKRDEERP